MGLALLIAVLELLGAVGLFGLLPIVVPASSSARGPAWWSVSPKPCRIARLGGATG